jgi:hypothetical protein
MENCESNIRENLCSLLFTSELSGYGTKYIQDTAAFGLPIECWEKLGDGAKHGDAPFAF